MNLKTHNLIINKKTTFDILDTKKQTKKGIHTPTKIYYIKLLKQ